MTRLLAVVGVPTSAGAHHAGQDQAPAALRAHGLLGRLAATGLDVVDTGDVQGSVWAPDAPGAPARNLPAVVAVAGRVADAVTRVASDGRIPLVVGGDCTITLGVVAGMQRVATVGVAYLDGDADLNSPGRTRSGVLDATGVAHLLGVADNELSRLGSRFPMLADDQLVLLGYDPDDPDSVDADALTDRTALRHSTYAELAADPVGLARDAVARLAATAERLVVHFDIDVVDGRELALANFPHYGTGLPVEVAGLVLAQLLAADALAAVVLTEVNPTHDPSGELLERYLDLVADAFAAATG